MSKYISVGDNLLIHGECIEEMKLLAIKGVKVDMILADLPYGTTRNKWDSIIPLAELWKAYEKITHDHTAIVLTAQLPFDKTLAVSNLKMLRYEWIWKKTQATGHLNARKMPMKNHENILVFYKKLPTYNPQLIEGMPYSGVARAKNSSSNYGKQVDVVVKNDGFRYPVTVQEFKRDTPKLHPTQKPLALFEYLIKTYTNPGDLVLDNVLGSGTTAIACENLDRRWIGMEMNEEYIQIIQDRLEKNKNG